MLDRVRKSANRYRDFWLAVNRRLEEGGRVRRYARPAGVLFLLNSLGFSVFFRLGVTTAFDPYIVVSFLIIQFALFSIVLAGWVKSFGIRVLLVWIASVILLTALLIILHPY